jgi:DNA-binding XRE family transcriptional regulator
MYLYNTIATHRKGWALSQRELGILLATCRANVSRLEIKSGLTSLPMALALQALFHTPVSELFPDEFRKAAALILPRLADFSIALEHEAGLTADRKRELLTDVADRLSLAELNL